MKVFVNLKRSKFLLTIVLTLTLMIGVISSAAYAHNVAAYVKAVNVFGYEYVNQNTIKVFFDKGIYVNQGQYKIETESGTPVSISGTASSGGCGWTNANAPGGTTVTITTGSNLAPNTRYKVKVSSTIQMGNWYHLTVGNYLLHKDVEFFFKTPNTDGTYSGTPQLTVIPSWNSAGLSANLAVISDIPIDTSYGNYNISDMKLQKSSSLNGTYGDVVVDTTLDSYETSGAECYPAQINDAHTYLFIPETLGGQASVAYNLLSENYYYRLVVPALKGANGGSILYSSAVTLTPFGTGSDTAAGLGNITPAVTGYTSSSVSLSWGDVATDYTGPAPSHYYVYYSSDPYFNFVKAADTVNESGTTNTCTVTGLSSGTTYYFRVVPTNAAYEEGGFSRYISQTTN
ncbi:MAG: fibronectin type III domain-containing protein [Clostridiaceae bacterium]